MLHLAKLCVGIREVAQLRRWQSTRMPLQHRTRSMPRRRDEILAGGSLYWVIAGAMVVRQRVVEIDDSTFEDGSRCCALTLDPALVPVVGRPMKPFQGWRYLDPAAAPADLSSDVDIPGELPESLRRELRALCLL